MSSTRTATALNPGEVLAYDTRVRVEPEDTGLKAASFAVQRAFRSGRTMSALDPSQFQEGARPQARLRRLRRRERHRPCHCPQPVQDASGVFSVKTNELPVAAVRLCESSVTPF